MAKTEARPATMLVIVCAPLVLAQAALAFRSGALRHDDMHTFGPALELVALLLIPAVFACWVWPRQPVASLRLSLAIILAAGAAMRLLHFGAGPIAETDHFRYLWDGALVAHGYDPYARAPTAILSPAGELDATLTELRAEGASVLSQINFPDLRTIYPGTAQVVFALAHGLTPFDLLGMRILLLMADVGTVLLLMDILRRTGRSLLWIAPFWLNPLAVLVTANQAHIDAVIPPLLIGALMAGHARRPFTAGMLMSLAAGIKIWPLLLGPLFVRAFWPVPRQVGVFLVSSASAAALLLGPLALSALEPSSGLTAYASGWAQNNGLYAWISWTAWYALGSSLPTETILRAMVAAVSGAVSLRLAMRPVASFDDIAVRTLCLSVTVFALSPAQFPWYALWFLPLAAWAQSRSLIAVTGLLCMYYLFFPLAAFGMRNYFVYGVALLHIYPLLLGLRSAALQAERSR